MGWFCFILLYILVQEICIAFSTEHIQYLMEKYLAYTEFSCTLNLLNFLLLFLKAILFFLNLITCT